jgi:hypothetical protein
MDSFVCAVQREVDRLRRDLERRSVELQQKTIQMEEQSVKAEKELQSVHADYKAKVGLTFWIYQQARCPLR